MNQKIDDIIRNLSDEDAAVLIAEFKILIEGRENVLDECERLSSELSYTKGKLNSAIVGLKDLLRNADDPWPFRDIELGGVGAEGHAKIRAKIAVMKKERLDERPDEPGVDPKAEYHTPEQPMEDDENR